MNGQTPSFIKPSARKRRAAEILGRNAEDDAANLLREAGFTVLARRLRTGAGEIDLVAANARMLVFVEVKARGSLAEAAYAVSARQQARLLAAAESALAQNPGWARPETRFDVALVAGGPVQIIEDAIRYS
ncbi:MAG: YraN family protein [Acidocella sp.]|nr:YraN family protein [Acidocella sp.]